MGGLFRGSGGGAPAAGGHRGPGGEAPTRRCPQRSKILRFFARITHF